MSNIQPIRSNVLVRPLESESISAGGIFVPDSFKEPSNKVEVMAVGNGIKNKPMQFKKGQTAFRVKSWGTPVEENGVLMFLMNQDALIATI